MLLRSYSSVSLPTPLMSVWQVSDKAMKLFVSITGQSLVHMTAFCLHASAATSSHETVDKFCLVTTFGIYQISVDDKGYKEQMALCFVPFLCFFCAFVSANTLRPSLSLSP